MDHLCYLCFVFAMLSRLFIAALWSTEVKGLTSWLLALVCGVYCDCVTFTFGILGQVWYMIVSIPDLCRLSYISCISYNAGGLHVRQKILWFCNSRI